MPLQSKHQGILVVPDLRLETFGRRLLSFTAAHNWNKLPVSLKTMSLFAAFKKHLKSFLFTKYFGKTFNDDWASESVWTVSLYSLLNSYGFRTIIKFNLTFLYFNLSSLNLFVSHKFHLIIARTVTVALFFHTTIPRTSPVLPPPLAFFLLCHCSLNQSSLCSIN